MSEGYRMLSEALTARAEVLNPAYRVAVQQTVSEWHRDGFGSGGKRAGDRAPDFTLAGHDGRPVTLSGLTVEGPVVLSFFRGEWCPFCRLEIDALVAVHDEIRRLGARLVMMSPQAPVPALAQRLNTIEGLILLRDASNGVALQFGLAFRVPDRLKAALLAVDIDVAALNGEASWLLPIPATYVIGRDGLVKLAHVDPDFTRRLEPETILGALAALA